MLQNSSCNLEKYIDIVSKSAFFDRDFYIGNNADISEEAEKHYVIHGSSEGRFPIPCANRTLIKLFSGKNKPDNPVIWIEKQKFANPKLYKILKVWRDIDIKNYYLIKNSKLFDPDFYMNYYKDVKSNYTDPVLHYLQNGHKESRITSPSFIHLISDLSSSRYGISVLAWEREIKYLAAFKKNEFFLNNSLGFAKNSYLDVNILKNMIDDDKVKIISFDIFDTLINRPVLEPENIFRLIEEIDASAKSYNFYDKRINILKNFPDGIANLDEIYEYMRLFHHLSHSLINKWKQLELDIESKLLRRKEIGHQLYKYAISKNKHIIAISDMYLDEEFINKILLREGYTKVKRIYISNNCNASKLTDLYEKVLESENIYGNEVLHIGDNIVADYYCALNSGYRAFWLPNSRDKILMNTKLGKAFVATNDIFSKMILGFIYNHIEIDYDKNIHNIRLFSDFNEMIKLCIFPIALSIALYIANNDLIQNGYKEIKFASRDGWLPFIIYDEIRKAIGGIKGEYIYAGRRAYYNLGSTTFIDYIEDCAHHLRCACQDCNFLNVINLAIPNVQLNNRIKQIISTHNISLEATSFNIDEFLKYAADMIDELEINFIRERNNTINYYKNKFSSSESRHIIFDLGFGGSVSKYISKAINNPLDKIYLFSVPPNATLDKINNSKTYEILPNGQCTPSYIHMVYEELFAKLEGGCIGFTESNPILESDNFNDVMKEKYAFIESKLKEYTIDFIDLFKELLKSFRMSDYLPLYKSMCELVFYHQTEVEQYFNSITFSDKVANITASNLAEKLSLKIEYPTPFAGTGFQRVKEYIKKDKCLYNNNYRICIHVHVHFAYLAQEIAAYLSKIPNKYSLVITYTEANLEDYLKSLFSNCTPNIEDFHIRLVPNRGRDVAPWVLNTRDLQLKYDIFCHIHGKVSPHFTWGSEWRHYLFDNLLSPSSFDQIMNIFLNNKNIGCIFPPQFKQLYDFSLINKIDQFGNRVELVLMQNMMKRMGFRPVCLRSNLIFSAGNMLWYRPQALKQLFSCPLRIEEFAKEPIGLGETLAHAIERLPGYICRENGYEIYLYSESNL